MQLPTKPIWTRTVAARIDALSTAQFGLTSLALMEVAGRAVADVACQLSEKDQTVIVLAGPGNNGGDGLVAARLLADQHRSVHVVLIPPDNAKPHGSPSFEAQLKAVRALGLPIHSYREGCLSLLAKTERVLIIDAVFGLGFKGPLTAGNALTALQEAANLPGRSVLAVDLPSGLGADEGSQSSSPLPADVTVTFGAPKPVHVISPARELCGRMEIIDIGFPSRAAAEAQSSEDDTYLLCDGEATLQQDPWSSLSQSANKFDRGHVLTIGGSEGKTGAPLLAALAALRAGCGWSTVSMPEDLAHHLPSDAPLELTFEPLFVGVRLDAKKLDDFISQRRVRAVVIGPGTMSSPLTDDTAQRLAAFSRSGGFVVCDAGATADFFGRWPDLGAEPTRFVLTPHPGEWRKLPLTANPSDVLGLQATREAAARAGVTLIYKGATPIITSPTGASVVVDHGDVTLARAGSGDVYAGVLAAHGAIGCSAVMAAARAQCVVAQAARVAARTRGTHAVLASDIINALGSDLL